MDKERIWGYKETERKRVKEAEKKALERFDSLMDTREGSGFVEITGRIGGDIETYRYFDDGTVIAG